MHGHLPINAAAADSRLEQWWCQCNRQAGCG
jgi:hypothetical protein